jgi:hypothetical protein
MIGFVDGFQCVRDRDAAMAGESSQRQAPPRIGIPFEFDGFTAASRLTGNLTDAAKSQPGSVCRSANIIFCNARIVPEGD